MIIDAEIHHLFEKEYHIDVLRE